MRADVRGGDGLRRHVSGVPVVLVARVEDGAEVRLHVRADERGAVHHLGDLIEAGADFHAIKRRVDGRKSAEDPVHRQAFLEWLVAFGIKGFRCRHAASHPQQDATIGGGPGVDERFRAERAGRAGHGGG